ncbi:MAG: uncharacterized protein KVP18_003478 [Porospora cf. gigantea A]|uniref:uncharacterized protein n=1 Tax=Porospora cf. gigantea A TaxID=2853593 RepID=UPI003559EC37|nr:MAG: hypothetical protein KVP18_003478 [Porospora cf. gigantea A]
MRNTDWWEMPFQRCILACQDLESTDKTPNAKKLHPNIPSFEEISETLGRSGSIRSICTQRGAITGSVLQRGVCGWYVTPEGPVVGRLTVSHSAVVFRPRGYGEGCKSDARIPSPERYFLRVDLSDLVECGTVCLPTSAQSRKYYEASVRHFPEMQTESPYDFAVDSPLSDKASHFYLQLLVNGGNAMAKEYVDDYESDTPAGNSQGLDDEKASLLRTYSLSGRESQDDTFTLNSYERLRYSVAHRNPLLPDQVLRLLNMKRKRSRRPRQQPSFILLRVRAGSPSSSYCIRTPRLRRR